MNSPLNTLGHLDESNPVGRPRVVTEYYLKRLRVLVSTSPKIWGYSFRRWTAHKLKLHLAQETGVDISARHVNRLLKKLGLSTRLSAAGATNQLPDDLDIRLKSGHTAGKQKPEILINDIVPNDVVPSATPDFFWEMDVVMETGLNRNQNKRGMRP